MIFLTPFDAVTKVPTGPSEDSGCDTLQEVVSLMGEPLCRAKRTATYDGLFYSDYNFTELGSRPAIDGTVTTR